MHAGARKYQSDLQRLETYAEGFFQKSGKTKWPTVREAARALRMTQAEVEQLCQELPLMLTSYYTVPATPLAEHFVEVCK